MFIEELGRELTGRQLEIWDGTSGLSPEKEEEYRQLWRRQAATAGAANQEVVRRPTPKRTGCGCHKPE